MRTVPILIAAHVCSMLGFSTYAALLPELRDEWSLSNAQAGIVGGMFFAGYVATVSLWTALTDRMDARRVYLAGSLFATAASAGFGLFANGFFTAALFPVAAWRKVMSDRASAGYTLGYAAHCLELFGSRAWVVAFLAYSASLHSGVSFPWHAAAIAAVVNLIAVPASIVGNEIALRM